MVLRLRKEDLSAAIEWLGRGRQYLVHGRHPSGVDYGWEGAPLWEVDPETLPEVSRVRAQAFLEHLATLLRDDGYSVEIVGSGSVKEAPPQEDLKAPSIEELEELIARIPNTYETRDEWIRFGYAVRAAAQDDVAAGLQIWQEFSARWEGWNDPELVEREWESFSPPFRVGWNWLQSQAFDVRDLFDADLDVAPSESDGLSSSFLRGIRSTELLRKGWSYLSGEKGRNRVRVFERAGGLLTLEFWDGGERMRIALGHSDRERAKRKADEVVAKLSRAESVIEEGQKEPPLRELFDIYLGEVSPKNGLRHRQYDQRAARMFVQYFGLNRLASTLSRRDWDRFIRDRGAGRIGPGSAPSSLSAHARFRRT